MRLVLASQSPRRADLLRAAGFTFDVLVVDIDERIRPDEAPQCYVRRLAMEKTAAASAAIARPTDDVCLLGADTAVVIDGNVLGKPRDDAEAAEMLRRLSGRWHQVMTGVSVRVGARETGRVEVTAVQFAALNAAQVAWYLESGEGRDKAGAYAIQGLASRFIPKIDGSYSNVVGLPVACVFELVEAMGFLHPAGSRAILSESLSRKSL
jgi:septum formation protein